MLRNNSDLKAWYKLYARKVEAQKSEESFSMTLRQVWRFMRDCQIVGPDCTLAQFNRLFIQGRKNNYELKPKAPVGDPTEGGKSSHRSYLSQIKMQVSQRHKIVDSSGDEEEDEDILADKPVEQDFEDVHLPNK